ncbi:MAG: DUF2975 domain-containing protein [Lachnospiraceae bacterium]|nr:DUF2975 domain-containing protein [Ruminococcus sp.]MCM1276550.1 DUF2975 domain-containing protein [Lachnospiraceae bacterium]
MWNKDKSIILSQILIKICYVGIVVCGIIAPKLVELYTAKAGEGGAELYTPLLATLMCCVPPGIIALVCLDVLLWNIQKNKAFVAQNVMLLRSISYCCFCVAVIFVYFSILRPFAFAIVFAAGFFGIILRVVKNCFQQAIALREENDFTI